MLAAVKMAIKSSYEMRDTSCVDRAAFFLFILNNVFRKVEKEKINPGKCHFCFFKISWLFKDEG